MSINSSIELTLQERGKRYGSFEEHAELTQKLKEVMHTSKNWRTLPPDLKESLEMIQHKVGRVLNGDFTYSDNFIDIAGYAKLVADRLIKNEK